MTLLAGLFTFLQGAAGIGELLGSPPRAYHVSAPQDAELPYSTYRIVSSPRHPHLVRPSGLVECTIQFEHVADDDASADAVCEAFRLALDGVHHQDFGDVQVVDVSLRNDSDGLDPASFGEEQARSSRVQEFKIWHRESIAVH